MRVANSRAGEGQRRAGRPRRLRGRGRRREEGFDVGVSGPLGGEGGEVGRPAAAAQQARRRVGQTEVAGQGAELAGLGMPQVLQRKRVS